MLQGRCWDGFLSRVLMPPLSPVVQWPWAGSEWQFPALQNKKQPRVSSLRVEEQRTL